MNKKGEPWASAQIEDLAGGIEVLFFPRTYAAVSIDVSEDAIVLVKGKVNKRDDRVSLFVEDLAVPDLSTGAGGAAPVRVQIESARCTPERVGEAQGGPRRPPGPERGAPDAAGRERGEPRRCASTTGSRSPTRAR